MTTSNNLHWRSLDEFDQPELMVERGAVEFADASASPFPILAANGRRDFLKAAGFLVGAATIGGCSRAPAERAFPLAAQPEGYSPGRTVQYATVCTGCPSGCGVLATVRDGRPLKLEGNPDHPISQGALCAVGQASILSLYDSLRLRAPRAAGTSTNWQAVDTAIVEQLEKIRGSNGAVRVLTPTITSPTLRAQINAFLAKQANGRHVMADLPSAASIRNAHQTLFGVRLLPSYDFAKAPVVASFDADFLGTWLSPVEFSRGYKRARHAEGKPVPEAWHLQVEAQYTLSGSKADARICVAPQEIRSALEAITARLASRSDEAFTPGTERPEGFTVKELDDIAERLWQARGRSLVLCGLADEGAQRLCAYANHLLQNYGATISLERPSLQRQGDDQALTALLGEIERGQVSALFVWGWNPVADLPLSAKLSTALRQIPLFVSLSNQEDESVAIAKFVCPDADPLESWGDAEPRAGLLTIQQPLLRPLGQARPAIESFACWSGSGGSAQQLVQAHWQAQVYPRAASSASFPDFWNEALQKGIVELPVPNQGAVWFGKMVPGLTPVDVPVGLQALLYQKVAMPNGRFAGNAFLQETPDPITKATWDNYVCLSPAKARELSVSDGDVVRGEAGGFRFELPVVVQPGQHDHVAAIALGYGRQTTARFAQIGPQWLEARKSVGASGLVGVNMAPLLRLDDEGFRMVRTDLRLEKTGAHRELALTQTHHTLKMPPGLDPGGPPRPIVLETNLLAKQEGHAAEHPELWPRDHAYTGHRWKLAIDLDACTGCAACVVACQIENNVPVVGRDEVLRNREMHWMRIDRYYSGPPENPRAAHQPMMCQHCEHAPCETVCPVLATVHSSEGLNQQVYNRCVGTRYCANNCPYKVRRFNWFDYPHPDKMANLLLNPDVTVRSRGVMEKCSLCVQRIQEARMEAKRQGKPLADGSILMACQQTCPAEAIVFGDANDENSNVAHWIASGRAYRVLEEINVRPAVHYLKVLRRDNSVEEGGQHG